MPIYEYVCASCGSAVERLRKFAEREQALDCPRCGSAALPVLSAAAVGGAGGAKSAPAPHCHSGPACCGGGCGPMN